jgi:hypothetical protein
LRQICFRSKSVKMRYSCYNQEQNTGFCNGSLMHGQRPESVSSKEINMQKIFSAAEKAPVAE